MDQASVFVWQFRDAISTRQTHITKISTKIIFDLSQWQQNHNITTDKKATISYFILEHFSGILPLSQWLCGNRPRDLCRGACVDIFRQRSFWLQILFCSCVNETTLFSFMLSLLRENGRSLRFPKILLKKQTRWSNDKTIIELGHRKIWWFVSVSQINYLPQPSGFGK